jgi:cytochrome P450
MLSVAPYTRHYDPDVYKDPHVLRPERWLGEEQHSLKDWWPFALGK